MIASLRASTSGADARHDHCPARTGRIVTEMEESQDVFDDLDVSAISLSKGVDALDAVGDGQMDAMEVAILPIGL